MTHHPAMPQFTPLPDDTLSTIYCTDENIATRAPNDFSVLCPGSNTLASGIDGYIPASMPWRLSSPSTNFGASGINRGNVVVLSAPVTRFPGTGEMFAIESVDGNSMILRRVGQAINVGYPPGTNANMTGVVFLVQTYQPQIEDVSYYLNRQYQINPSIPARRPSQLYEIRDLRDACVLEVLCRRLMTEVNPSAGSSALQKYAAYREELSKIQGRLHLRWKPTIYGDAPTSNPFSTRIVR